VDDEDLVRLVISRRLGAAGFDAAVARDGVEAIERLATAEVDLVLTDLNMPRCNGEQLCREIRATRAIATIPVVLMTGGPIDEAQMRAAGCDAVIYKPLPESLPDLLRAMLPRTGDPAPPDPSRPDAANGTRHSAA
jgi:CheY-like chemotaxis protein